MNLARHFETYRASLKKDALGGCIEYAKSIPTAKPEEFPLVYDYLHLALEKTNAALQKKDGKEYRNWVCRHQKAMIALFDRMVEDVMWDYVNTTPETIYNLVQERGWGWFKFCRKTLGLTMRVTLDGVEQRLLMTWVPRYSPEFEHHWSSKDRVAFDADELSWFLVGGKTPTETHPLLKFKLENPRTKFLKVEENQIFHKPVEKINEGDEVLDWSMPLF